MLLIKERAGETRREEKKGEERREGENKRGFFLINETKRVDCSVNGMNECVHQ